MSEKKLHKLKIYEQGYPSDSSQLPIIQENRKFNSNLRNPLKPLNYESPDAILKKSNVTKLRENIAIEDRASAQSFFSKYDGSRNPSQSIVKAARIATEKITLQFQWENGPLPSKLL